MYRTNTKRLRAATPQNLSRAVRPCRSLFRRKPFLLWASKLACMLQPLLQYLYDLTFELFTCPMCICCSYDSVSVPEVTLFAEVNICSVPYGLKCIIRHNLSPVQKGFRFAPYILLAYTYLRLGGCREEFQTVSVLRQ